MQIHFAPIQGQTDHIYRKAHHSLIGGVDCYYTPFVRWEHGGIRNKDIRDIAPESNKDLNVVPQIIAKDRDEFCHLCDAIQEMGWNKINLNMGCPFPLQTHAGRGAGLLAHTNNIEYIAREIECRSDVCFSVKMRIGMNSADEGTRIIPLLNELKIAQVTVHPRLGIDQYKGALDMESFKLFYNQLTMPLLYNGDLVTTTDIKAIEHSYPNLEGVMIGRGLLANPLLAIAHKTETNPSHEEIISSILKLHDAVLTYAISHLQGDSQILSRLQEFWQTLESVIDKKTYKKLTKCNALRTYNEALANIK